MSSSKSQLISKSKSNQQYEEHEKDQHHNTFGEFIKSAVYGGLDGLCTTLVIVISTVSSSNNSIGVNVPSSIMAIGFASVLGDGLAMGAADYLGTKSDDEYMMMEEERQRMEIENDFQAQKQEMVELYTEMGLQPNVANEIVSIMSKNKQGFLKIMMIEELHLIAGEESPFKNSLVTFISFAIFGMFPLIPSIIAYIAGDEKISDAYFYATMATAVVVLGVLGLAKSIVGGSKWYRSVPETIFVGALSAGAAYGVGKLMGE